MLKNLLNINKDTETAGKSELVCALADLADMMLQFLRKPFVKVTVGVRVEVAGDLAGILNVDLVIFTLSEFGAGFGVVLGCAGVENISIDAEKVDEVGQSRFPFSGDGVCFLDLGAVEKGFFKIDQ